ncbi:MAG TPA: hypothetical protein EYP55_06590 [Anaerolineae bacterium]|nr:hypothetical protein [Anaerolineae bacterium]
MHILTIVQGEYGQRMVENIRRHGPAEWTLETWTAPRFLPPMMDDPDEFLPEELPAADLVISFGEHPGVAQLLPEIARLTGARALIAPVDNEAWLPRGLANQLKGWLEEMGVAAAFPKPLCSLTEESYNLRHHRQGYENPLIAEFARHFGMPRFRIEVDEATRTITSVEVERDTVCGCAHFVAQGLVGVPVEEAEEKAGLLHHHYPCMAAMGMDDDYHDTLMHVSGHITRERVKEQIKPFLRITYITPPGRASEVGDHE